MLFEKSLFHRRDVNTAQIIPAGLEIVQISVMDIGQGVKKPVVAGVVFKSLFVGYGGLLIETLHLKSVIEADRAR